jgi:hypothetical protein
VNRSERRRQQKQEKRILRTAATGWTRTLRRSCAACGGGPSWEILQHESSVWYLCASCGQAAFRVPFNSGALAAEFVQKILAAEPASP